VTSGQKKFLCVLPARGGSERLPGKNIRLLCGKPMIAYTIECARTSGVFDEIYVSTDSQEIAEAARAFGASAPTMLPARFALPDQASMGACAYMHDWLQNHGMGKWDYLFCLQPTSPLRQVQDIIAAKEIAEAGDLEHVVSCTPIDPHYHHWAMREQDGLLQPVFGPEYHVDRKYLPEALRPNGAIKIMRTDLIKKHETFFDSNKVGFIKMPEERSVHVAFETDFLLAEVLLKARSG